MSGRQSLQPRRGAGEPRGGIGQDQRLRRFHAAERIAGPLALRRDLALSHAPVLMRARPRPGRAGRRQRRSHLR